MKFQPLSFTIPVLIVAGVISSALGYFTGGVPKAIELAAVFLAASIVGLLVGHLLRRSNQVKLHY